MQFEGNISVGANSRDAMRGTWKCVLVYCVGITEHAKAVHAHRDEGGWALSASLLISGKLPPVVLVFLSYLCFQNVVI